MSHIIDYLSLVSPVCYYCLWNPFYSLLVVNSNRPGRQVRPQNLVGLYRVGEELHSVFWHETASTNTANNDIRFLLVFPKFVFMILGVKYGESILQISRKRNGRPCKSRPNKSDNPKVGFDLSILLSSTAGRASGRARRRMFGGILRDGQRRMERGGIPSRVRP